LVTVLEGSLRLLHPFMPFVTEEIWQHLKAAWPQGEAWGDALIIRRWPSADAAALDEQAEAEMGLLMDLIRQARNARTEFDVPAGKRIPAIVAAGGRLPMVEAQRGLLTFLARLDETQLTIAAGLSEKPRQAVALVAGDVEAYLPLAGLVDLEQELARLRKAVAEADQEIRQAEGRLANEAFTAKAPPHVVQQQRDRLAAHQERRDRLQTRLDALQ
jgi:valyl-tRNA synthetase